MQLKVLNASIPAAAQQQKSVLSSLQQQRRQIQLRCLNEGQTEIVRMATTGRRRVLIDGASAAFAAVAAAVALPLPLPALAADAADSAADADADAADFYQRWPYQKPSDILPWIRARAAPGDAAAVLAAMDAWAAKYPMYAIGAEKGAMLDAVLADLRPALALELGSFLGYSATRTALRLAPGGLLVCIGEAAGARGGSGGRRGMAAHKTFQKVGPNTALTLPPPPSPRSPTRRRGQPRQRRRRAPGRRLCRRGRARRHH